MRCAPWVVRDPLGIDLYAGMHIAKMTVFPWTRIDMPAMTVRNESTKTGEPLEFPAIVIRAGQPRHCTGTCLSEPD